MPKEIRNPKSEGRIALARSVDYWSDGSASAFVLNEEAPVKRDLMERTALFGESIIRFAKKVPSKPENKRLVEQLVGAATSIGANYCEADNSVSRKDFKLKISICRKESKETMFFLRMLAASEDTLKDEARALWREAKELNLICGAIWRK